MPEIFIQGKLKAVVELSGQGELLTAFAMLLSQGSNEQSSWGCWKPTGSLGKLLLPLLWDLQQMNTLGGLPSLFKLSLATGPWFDWRGCSCPSCSRADVLLQAEPATEI